MSEKTRLPSAGGQGVEVGYRLPTQRLHHNSHRGASISRILTCESATRSSGYLSNMATLRQGSEPTKLAGHSRPPRQGGGIPNCQARLNYALAGVTDRLTL